MTRLWRFKSYCEACGRVLPSKAKAVGGKARWANSTPEQRSEHARKMVMARVAKRAKEGGES